GARRRPSQPGGDTARPRLFPPPPGPQGAQRGPAADATGGQGCSTGRRGGTADRRHLLTSKENRLMSTGVATPADEEVLRRCRGRAVLAAAAGGRATVAGIDRRRFNLTTSYAAEVLTVRLDTGAAFRVFLKDFGSSVRPKDGPRQRREREVRVYQELLAG